MDTKIDRTLKNMGFYIDDIELIALPWGEAYQVGFSIEWWDVIKSFEKTVAKQLDLLTEEQKAQYDDLLKSLEKSKDKIKELGLVYPDFVDA
jgi:hypothetical protein